VAVQAGNKIILVCVDSQNRLFAKAFDLETGLWGQTFEIPSQGVQFSPAIAASGESRVDVVYVGMDQAAYHRSLDVQARNFQSNVGTAGISYGPETRIDGTITSAPFLASSGFKQLELIARGTDNRLYHNHFAGPVSPTGLHDGRQINRGWQGWEDASELLFGSIQLRRFSDNVALTATRDGRVHMVARGRGENPQPLFHNSYDSNLHGIAPWKAVHWRGFDRIAAQQFVGAPALALSGRALEVVIAGNQNIPFHFNLSDAILSPLSFVENLPVGQSSEPVVLSSHAGLVDVLFIGQDGKPQHLRRLNNRQVWYEIIPSTMSVSAIAATSLGDGQIELVATTPNRTLHQWRYIHGVWNGPAQIASAISSKPAIVSLGAGELALLAIGEDRQLRYLKFENGRWQTPQQIFTLSRVSAARFGPSSVSSWGDGTVDVMLVDDGNGRMLHRRILPNEEFPTGITLNQEGPSKFSSLNHQATDTPILTAFGPHRLNVVVKGADGRVYSYWTKPPAKAEQPESPMGFPRVQTTPSSSKPSSTQQDATMQPQRSEDFQIAGRASFDTTKTNQNPTVRQRDFDLNIDSQKGAASTTPQVLTTQPAIGQSGLKPASQIEAGLSDKVIAQKAGPEPLVQWGESEPIGRQNIAVGGVAKPSEQELVAVAVDPAGRIYVNRYFGWRWNGFAPIIGQSDGVQAHASIKPSIAAH
jgi:hypothetical protein